MRAVDFPSSFGAGCALTSGVTLEDDGSVENVSAERKVKMFATI